MTRISTNLSLPGDRLVVASEINSRHLRNVSLEFFLELTTENAAVKARPFCALSLEGSVVASTMPYSAECKFG